MGNIAGFFEVTGLATDDISAIKDAALKGKTSELTDEQLKYWNKYKDQIASYYSTTSQSIVEDMGKIVTSDLEDASFDVTGFDKMAIFQDTTNFRLETGEDGRVTAYLAKDAEITYDEYKNFLEAIGTAWDRKNELLM